MALVYNIIFGRLGRLMAHAETVRTFQSDLETEHASTVAEFSGGDMTQIASITQNLNSRMLSAAQTLTDLQISCTRTLIDLTDANFTLESLTLSDALNELIRQMIADGETIAANTSTAGSATAGASNVGNGTMVMSAVSHELDRFGNRHGCWTAQHIKNETFTAVCNSDSSNTTIESGSENFAVKGQRVTSISDYEWPQGSGLKRGVTCVNPRDNGGRGPGRNVCTNSDFEDFDSNTPAHWTINSGSAGVNVFKSTDKYSGTNCLRLVGDGSTVVSLSQTLNSTLGSRGYLNTDQPYSISFAIKYATLAPSAAFRIKVTKSDGSTIYNSSVLGREMSKSVLSASLTTSYQLIVGTAFMPTELDKGSKVVLEFTTAAANTSEVFVDHLAIAQMPAIGNNMGHMQLIGGSTPFRIGDRFTAAFTNDNAGQFQTEFDRFFSLQQSGLQIPATTGSETILDTLIA